MLDSLARSYGDEAEQEDERARADLREAGAEPEDFAEPKSAPEAQAAQPFLPGVIELGPTSLKNIRIIEELPLDFARAQDHRGQWIVLVGENGSGKSSILRALALTLTTYGVAVHGHGDFPAGLVGSSGNVGACTVVCNGEEYRLTLTKGAREVELKQEPNGTTPRPLVFGYGCRRGSIFGGPRVADIERVTSDIDTLFNELVRIFPTFDWLKRQKLRALQEPAYAPIYERLMDGICSLLPDVERIDIYGDDLWAIAPKLGGDVSVAALSDGYLTTIGWVVNIIARWFEPAKELHVPVDKDFFENMTGVVLLDEPDLHLHPRWQMRAHLRRAPALQEHDLRRHHPQPLYPLRRPSRGECGSWSATRTTKSSPARAAQPAAHDRQRPLRDVFRHDDRVPERARRDAGASTPSSPATPSAATSRTPTCSASSPGSAMPAWSRECSPFPASRSPPTPPSPRHDPHPPRRRAPGAHGGAEHSPTEASRHRRGWTTDPQADHRV